MAQNSFFTTRSIKSHKSLSQCPTLEQLPQQGYSNKSHSDLLNNLLEIIFRNFKAYLQELNFRCLKFFKLFVRFIMLLEAPTHCRQWASVLMHIDVFVTKAICTFHNSQLELLTTNWLNSNY